jgi:hypothetical protein
LSATVFRQFMPPQRILYPARRCGRMAGVSHCRLPPGRPGCALPDAAILPHPPVSRHLQGRPQRDEFRLDDAVLFSNSTAALLSRGTQRRIIALLWPCVRFDLHGHCVGTPITHHEAAMALAQTGRYACARGPIR